MPESRYDRQHGMPELANGGQDKLAAACITVVGAGGLGSSLLLALAGTGIRQIRIIDYDFVSLSNLNRQFLYTPADIGQAKVERAALRLKQYNPELQIASVNDRLDCHNQMALLADSDLVIAAVDSQATRYRINEACCYLSKPYIDGAVNSFYGYVSHIAPGRSACFVCQNGKESQLAKDKTQNINKQQVIGTTPAVIGAMQAQLAVNIILGCNQAQSGSRYYYNGKDQSIERIDFARDPKCSCCHKDCAEQTKTGVMK